MSLSVELIFVYLAYNKLLILIYAQQFKSLSIWMHRFCQ